MARQLIEETEVKHAAAVEILTKRRLKRGESDEAELAEATRVVWEHCENLARQRNPSDLNLARAIRDEKHKELDAYNDDDLQRITTGPRT